MGFQIFEKVTGEALPIKTLEVLAANFWQVPVDPRKYASPPVDPEKLKGLEGMKKEIASLSNMHLNWFDTIGWAIHYLGDQVEEVTWGQVAHYLYEGYEEFMSFKEFYTCAKPHFFIPHIWLMVHWSNMGLQPKFHG